jgi:2-oxoglutarate ferredoxin oxidoreductase subunit alpha
LNLKKAGYQKNPLEDGSLSGYRVISIPLTELNLNALKELGLGKKESDRCKNFFALGMMYWLYDRPLDPTLKWMQSKFQKNPVILEANVRALRAGFNYADTTELFTTHYRVRKASLTPESIGTLPVTRPQRWDLSQRHTWQAAAVLRELSDHASQRYSS